MVMRKVSKKRQSRKRKSKALINGYLEKVSSKIFSNFPQQLTDLIGRQHGIYALYKGSRLYYVGLATNLRGRIRQHTRDKHSGKWDKFSLYLIRKADHIKELEAIVMMVADPAGNTSRSRLPQAINLKSELFDRLKAEQEKRLDTLLGGRKRRSGKIVRLKSNPKKKDGIKSPTLCQYIEKRFRIKGEYKGRLYLAVVYKNGTIRFNSKSYDSPSSAGQAARKRRTNGWVFWRFRNNKGKWVKLDELRR